MKIIIKCGNDPFKPQAAIDFFTKNILNIAGEIAIEVQHVSILVYKDEDVTEDLTVEIIVELEPKIILMAMDQDYSEADIKCLTKEYVTEALAIQEVERLNPFFSREYYSCIKYVAGPGIKDFNFNHPEKRQDETFIKNVSIESFQKSPYVHKRLGKDCYNINGKAMNSKRFFPMFVKTEELDQKRS